MKSYRLSIVASTFMALTASCDHKELSLYSMPASDVRVVYDWSLAPEADPESMIATFFNKDHSIEMEPVLVAFPGRNGGLLRLPPGKYEAVSHNSILSSWAIFRGTETIDDYEIYTDDAGYLTVTGVSIHSLPRSGNAGDERIAITPEMLWNGHEHDISIASNPKEPVEIVFTPEEAICYYDVTIYNVKNLKYLNDSRIDATLSGMAEGFLHGSHSPTSIAATMLFTLYASARNSSGGSDILKSSFYTFGEPAGLSPKHTVSIYVLYNDGTAGSFYYDVTDQVHNAPDPRHVHIVLDGLTLPKPLVNGGGLHPTVNEWEEEYVSLDM